MKVVKVTIGNFRIKVKVNTTTIPGDAPYIQGGFWFVSGVSTGILATGPTGQSAYQIAVTNGFVGTEPEWITFLSTNGAAAVAANALAQKWASEAEDVVVQSGEFSSKHYSIKSAATLTSVVTAGTTAVTDIETAGDAEILDIETAGDAEILDIAAAGDAEILDIAAAGTTAVNTITPLVTSTETAATTATTQAGLSATAKTEAETARDAILNKAEVNLTALGNILRADGNVYKAINEKTFLQNRAVFERSPLHAVSGIKRVEIWDSFTRANQTGLGTADSGQTWLGFGALTSFNISNNDAHGTGALSTVFANVINRNIVPSTGPVGRGSCAMGAIFRNRNSDFGFIYGIDISNFIYSRFSGANLETWVVIAGVGTLIDSFNLNVSPFLIGPDLSFNIETRITLFGIVRLQHYVNTSATTTIQLTAAQQAVFNGGKSSFVGIRMVRVSSISVNRVESFYLKNIDGKED